MRIVSDKSCTENQNTHFVLGNIFSKICAIYELMWRNMVEPDTPNVNITRRSKRGDLHAGQLSIHNAHCFPTATMATQTRLDGTFYVYCLSLIMFVPSL